MDISFQFLILSKEKEGVTKIGFLTFSWFRFLPHKLTPSALLNLVSQFLHTEITEGPLSTPVSGLN